MTEALVRIEFLSVLKAEVELAEHLVRQMTQGGGVAVTVRATA
ncbi:hypothetical protein [Nocardia nova]